MCRGDMAECFALCCSSAPLCCSSAPLCCSSAPLCCSSAPLCCSSAPLCCSSAPLCCSSAPLWWHHPPLTLSGHRETTPGTPKNAERGKEQKQTQTPCVIVWKRTKGLAQNFPSLSLLLFAGEPTVQRGAGTTGYRGRVRSNAGDELYLLTYKLSYYLDNPNLVRLVWKRTKSLALSHHISVVHGW
jgi:hypothetical protein